MSIRVGAILIFAAFLTSHIGYELSETKRFSKPLNSSVELLSSQEGNLTTEDVSNSRTELSF
jgi:hypothetical protein